MVGANYAGAMSTTDFEQFIFSELLDEDDFEDIEALDRAVETSGGDESCDPFRATVASNGALIVKGRHETLVLGSQAARAAFREHLHRRFAEGFASVDLWAGYRRVMAKDNS